jgi:hypothetical protein
VSSANKTFYFVTPNKSTKRQEEIKYIACFGERVPAPPLTEISTGGTVTD